MWMTPAFSTAASIRSASFTLFASGFSHNTVLPAWAAAMAISVWLSPGVETSTTSMSGRVTTSRQSADVSSQPYSRALAARSFSRPQITLRRGVRRGEQNAPTCRHALEWALPMNPAPMSAMFKSDMRGILQGSAGGNQTTMQGSW